MEIFTYKNYINSIHTFRLNNNIQLAEEGEKYNINNQKNKPTKRREKEFIEKTLKNKREIAYFFNKYLNPREKLIPNNLIECTKIYKLKGIIIYKIINKEEYIMIKYQENIDHNISYEVLNNCVNIIQKWKRNKNICKVKEYPIIIPIIIYTGKKEWNIKRKQQKNIKSTIYMKNRIDLGYNLVDFNKFYDYELKKIKSLLEYILLIEKLKNKGESINKVKGIIKTIKDEKNKERIKEFIETLSIS